ncbi:MAG: hypothetical protein KAI45_10240, partial [Melioribacteraceae bacterium]|nr:hypothetical protein [Melioribacteraceae bacterium]
LKQNGVKIKEIKLTSLSPEKPLILMEEIEIENIKINDISLSLMHENGEVISNVLAVSKKPVKRDSYFAPKKYAEKEREDFSAEGIFAKAEVLLNDWFYHLPEIKKILSEVLIVDPGFSRAHTELGLMDLRGGKFKEALDHFNKSLKRIPDDGRTLYYKGLTHMYMRDIIEAKYFLRQSGRFGYEYPERIAEAEIAIANDNLEEAKHQLDKAIILNGTILKGFIFKALVEKRLGNSLKAEKMLDRASLIDSENPFVFCTEYIISNLDESLAETIKNRYENYPEEILEVVATFYGAGLIEEALQSLNLIQQTNSIVELYKTELENLTNKKISFDRSESSVPEFAWRLEEYFILKRKIKENPNDAELYYHLGNFSYGHDFEIDGNNNWKKAYELGYENKVMLVSLYRANKKLGNTDEAYKYLVDAYKANKNDPYILEYYVDEIQIRKGVDDAIALMEEHYDDFENVYSLKAKLMNSYLFNGHYSKLESLLKKSNLHDTHRLSFGEFWKNLKMANGYNKLKEKKYKEALLDFKNSTEVPQNIAQHYMASFSAQARRLFYMGYCNNKLGNKEKAKELWNEALELKRAARFQTMYKYRDIKTIYYQAFCLKGLGRFDEAERYIMLLDGFANSTSLKNNDAVRTLLLSLSIAGLEDIDQFEKWDSELGLIKVNANFNAPEE